MKPLPRTIAGKIQMISELADTNVYGFDEDGNKVIVGQKEPIITLEQALELLNGIEE